MMTTPAGPKFHAVSTRWSDAVEKLRAELSPAFEKATAVRPRPLRLFHFTDCDGLLGIVQSQKLRASLATSLNDPSEIQYCVNRLGKLVADGSIHAKHLELNKVDDLLKARKVEWRTYVVSFCETEDTALHWLHYGRSGFGVAIGCDPETLERDPFRLFPVIYDDGAQHHLFDAVVGTIDAVLDEFIPTLANDDERLQLKDIAAGLAADTVWLAAPLMKNPAFGAEQEWRLVTFDPKGAGVPLTSAGTAPTFFRSTAGRIVPFKECAIEITPRFEVVLGFSSPMQPDESALAILLEDTLGSRLSVRRSEIPIRS